MQCDKNRFSLVYRRLMLISGAMAALAFGSSAQATNPVSSFRSPPSTVNPKRNAVPPSIISHKLPAFPDGARWRVHYWKLDYAEPRLGVPTTQEIMQWKLVLGYKPGKIGGYVYPYLPSSGCGPLKARPGIRIVHVSLAELNNQEKPGIFYYGAILWIESQITQGFLHRGIGGVGLQLPTVEAHQLATHPGSAVQMLTLALHIAVVTGVEVRPQVAKRGLPLPAPLKELLNMLSHTPNYNWIARNSPVQPWQPSTPMLTDNLFLDNKVADYCDALEQAGARYYAFPIITTGNPKVPDSINLTYSFQQVKPWTAYFMLSNSGPSGTSAWRQQYGFSDVNLTGHDDSLNLVYNTAGFTSQNSVNASYYYPLIRPNIIRVGIYGVYGNLQSSVFGIPGPYFVIEEELAGAEGIVQILQYHKLFVDLTPGLQYEHIRATYPVLDNLSAGANVIEPFIKLEASRQGDTSSFDAEGKIMGGFINTEESELATLGRSDVAKDWAELQGHLVYSFYLEPLLDSTQFCEGKSTLANEIRISLQGQDALGNRLIPEEEFTSGWAPGQSYGYVRGYPTDSASGDSGVIANLEYRLHVPHLFPVQKPWKLFGRNFRFAPSPKHPYLTSWDLVPFAFLDAGEITQSNIQPSEQNSTLVGTGLGVDMSWRHVAVGADWGVALNPIGVPGVNRVSAGSSEFNFALTVSY